MKKQQGLTLIEIMISLALGLFIIAATLSVYINTIKMSGNTIKSVRLNHDLGMAMSLMSNDIKRAGSWGDAIIDSNSLNNPFTTTATQVNTAASAAPNNVAPYNFTPTNVNILSFTDDLGVAHANGCILYSYDANNDGHYDDTPADTTYTVNDTNEFYGFRWNAGSIQIRTTGTTTVNCTDGNWERITDENVINITDVQFSFLAMPAVTVATAAAPRGYPALAATTRCTDISTTATPNTNETTNCFGLTFTPAPSASATHSIAVRRVVNIRLTGQLLGDDNAEVTKSLSNTVEIRNNHIYTIAAAPTS